MRARLPFLRLVVGLGSALVLATALVFALVRIDRVVVARGTLVGGSSALRAPLAGSLREAHARPGEQVERGDLLFVFEDAGLRAELAALEAEIAAGASRAAALAERLRAGREERVPSERARGELELQRAVVLHESARRRAAALDELRAEGLVAELAYQDALDELRSAELAVEQRRLAESSSAEALASELVSLEAELRAVSDDQVSQRARREELERRLARTRVVAESAGRWTGAAPEELVGRSVVAGEELGRIASARPGRFQGRIDDLGRAHVEGPLPVRVRVDGYPWLLHGSVAGRLTRVDDVASGASGFEVEVELEPRADSTAAGADAPALYEGMRAEGRILVEEEVSLWRLLCERLLWSETP